MNCIDFDQQFQRYVAQWVRKNGDKYKNNMDVIEDMMPDVYQEFLEKPAAWLGGAAPGTYFEQFDDARELVAWLREYTEKNVAVPDVLLERITELGGAAETALLSLLDDEHAADELRMMAVSLLGEMESVKPMRRYIGWIAALEPGDVHADLCDLCAEMLTSMGGTVVEPILEALDSATQPARDVFADILSNFPGDERIYALLMERFAHETERRALFASYLAKLGDARALPALIEAAASQDINYLDFVELSSAIEALGGERPAEREFAGDPYYESLKRV